MSLNTGGFVPIEDTQKTNGNKQLVIVLVAVLALSIAAIIVMLVFLQSPKETPIPAENAQTTVVTDVTGTPSDYTNSNEDEFTDYALCSQKQGKCYLEFQYPATWRVFEGHEGTTTRASFYLQGTEEEQDNIANLLFQVRMIIDTEEGFSKLPALSVKRRVAGLDLEEVQFGTMGTEQPLSAYQMSLTGGGFPLVYFELQFDPAIENFKYEDATIQALFESVRLL